MAVEVLGVLEMVLDGPAHLVGFSDGGNVALLVALDHSELVGKLVTIGANFHYSGLMPLPLAADSPAISRSSPMPTDADPRRTGSIPVVFEKTETMFATKPTLTVSDLGRIANPALVMAGDDAAIRLGHTCRALRVAPSRRARHRAGRLAPAPHREAARHRGLICFFRRAGPPVTFMPIRRGPTYA